MQVPNNQIADKETLVLQLKDLIRDQIERVGQSSYPEDTAGLYFLTTHFHEPSGQGSMDKKLRYVIDTVPYVYSHILNKTVRRHQFKSRTKYHPFMLSFVDYSGSRENAHSLTHIPHIHSILVVHPTVDQRFRDLMTQGFRLNEMSKTTNRIQRMEAKEIGADQNDLFTVIDYSSKSYCLKRIPFVPKELQADMMVLNGGL